MQMPRRCAPLTQGGDGSAPSLRPAPTCALCLELLVASGVVHLPVCGTCSGPLGSARHELAGGDGGALHPPHLVSW
jgi:hypothetical protein